MTGFEIGIIGAGGFAREVLAQMLSDGFRKGSVGLYVDDEYIADYPQAIPISELQIRSTRVLVAVGNPLAREKIVNSLPEAAEFATFVHSSAQILGEDVLIGRGSIICANALVTTNIHLGDHCHLNLATTIGHDCRIGDFFTAAPGANISGNCLFGDRIYLGTNASIREKISICSDVTIGLNSGVVRDIAEPGTYVGVPARRLA